MRRRVLLKSAATFALTGGAMPMPAIAQPAKTATLRFVPQANLTLLDLAGSWRVKAEALRSRSQNSWLLGKRLRGRIAMTIAAGRVAFE